MKEKQENNLKIESNFYRPIPLSERILRVYIQNNLQELKDKAYKENIKITKFTNEPLVNLSALGINNQSFEWGKRHQLDAQGFNKIKPYLRKDVFVRKTVAEKLAGVDKRLKKARYYLYVRSGFRHPLTQEVFFQAAKEKFSEDFARSRLAQKEDLIGLDSNYPHSTGGVVDVEIWKNGKKIEMGKERIPVGIFDLELLMSGDTKCSEARRKLIQTKISKAFIEAPKEWSEYLKNRRLLYHLMREAGFYFNFNEFWHWGIGDHLSGIASYLLDEKDYKPWYGLAKLPK